ncbi:DeoR/GlpR family DNA-binding transcription regulator [Alkalihalophilus lindianensis]|uniref:DeoR/GlpR family DNA-binding transcription regulator n=1 Tax=Alkalihalophilus lindianensis TaxID=1630542 RepID=A0ABU3X824_9BACI|nr:DeoR/GlpR family DNA-binding transcription regulator [Alkalihalophilus lindianensis]MDV2684037.1 DeoR/GlpR family DNA-binding transcription regulator [Alkalihalophilus lindianensis]
MLIEERRDKILQLLYKHKSVMVNELAQSLNTSVHTIRNDLSYLEKENLLRRTHGGAILNEKSIRRTFQSSVRYGESDDSQHAIAKEAAQHIEEGTTVYIGGSTTHYLMLQYINTSMNFTVVTNSLKIAIELSTVSNIDCYIVGGKVPYSANTNGSLTLELMRQFNFDTSFINTGIDAFSGLTTSNPEVALIQKAIIKQSKRVIFLGNHYRVGITSFFNVCSLEKVHTIIFDSNVPEAEKDNYKENHKYIEIIQT